MSAIVHMVMWKLNGVTPAVRLAQAELMVQAFETARSQVPGLLRMEVGGNMIEVPDAWDLALSMVFASRADLEAYNTHPAHLRIKTLMGPMRLARCQVDFEVRE
jgi:hypothetical protein